MRVFEDKYGWQPIDNAPLDEDVALLVTDGRGGEPYRLPYPCRHTAAGWVSSNKGTLQIEVKVGWYGVAEPFVPAAHASLVTGKKAA
jgi:hypothetical protein